MSDLPTIATVEELVARVRAVGDDATACTRTIATLRVTTDEELRVRWAPIIAEAVAKLAKSSRVLKEVVLAIQKHCPEPGVTWSQAPPPGVVAPLVRVGTDLSDLLVRLKAAEMEIETRDLMVRLRGSALGQLPQHERRAIRRQVAAGQLWLAAPGTVPNG